MSRNLGNGIIEMVDEKDSNTGFFCMKLLEFLSNEVDIGTSEYAYLWNVRFTQAKNHMCFYKYKCQIYAQSNENQVKKPLQLSFNL